MVDKSVLAAKLASVRDAVARIRSVVPKDEETFLADRTAREVVLLNLFVALQDILSLATHWLSDEGEVVPQSYRDVFRLFGERGVIPTDLANRLAAAAGLRNLVAHQYAVIDWQRIYEIASGQLGDLLLFCETLAQKAEAP